MLALIPAFAALVKHEAPPTGSEPLGGDALHAIGCHLVRALCLPGLNNIALRVFVRL